LRLRRGSRFSAHLQTVDLILRLIFVGVLLALLVSLFLF